MAVGLSSSGSREEVSDLLGHLHLMIEEKDVIVDSDDEVGETTPSEWLVIGKALSPKPIHILTIFVP